MSKIITAALCTLYLSLVSFPSLSATNEPELYTQKLDWNTVIINNSENKGIVSYTSNTKSGSMGASCEFDGQKYNHIHFVMPSYLPQIYKANNGLNYVDIYLKAGRTEFSTSLIAGQSVSGAVRLYYPTYQSNGSIIQRLIEARELELTYRLADSNEVVTESFSLMGYTHNVTTNVNLCEKLNREIILASRANTPRNNVENNGAENGKQPNENKPSRDIGIGTCFAVSPKGHLVTNDHVTRNASQIIVRMSNGELHNAELIKTSPSTDLSLLKINAETSDFLPIMSSRKVKKGDRVFTIGYPMASTLGIEAKYTEGVISSLSGLHNEPIVYQITVPIQPGNSGGPLVNETGHVVGVITSTASSLEFFEQSGVMPQNINWAVKSDYLTPLLDSYSLGEKLDSRNETINSAEKAVCMVITES